MSNNSIAALFKAKSLEEQSVTQFPAENEWYQFVDGLLLQGSKLDVAGGATVTVDFVAAFPKQVLGVFLSSSGIVQNVGLETFDIVNDATAKTFYWWAIGV